MSREIRIGLAVLAAILLIYLSLAWIKRMHFFAPEEQTYEIRFEQVAGLLEGDPVYVRGYLVGRVLSIVPSSQDVRVRIALDERIELFSDAYAEIQLKELMSGKQVAVFPGGSSSPYPVNEPMPGKASLDFSSGFSQLTEIAAGLPPDRILHLLNQVDTITQNLKVILQAVEPADIQQSLRQLNNSTRLLQQLAQDIQDRQLVAQLDQSLRAVKQLAGAADSTLNHLDQLTTEVDVQALNASLNALNLLLNRGDSLLTDVEGTLELLASDSTLAGKLLRDPSLGPKLDSTLYWFNEVLLQINQGKLYISLGKNKRKP